MSKIQTRNKMADKIHENKFYFVANAQLFDRSEQIEMSPMQLQLSTSLLLFTFLYVSLDIITK